MMLTGPLSSRRVEGMDGMYPTSRYALQARRRTTRGRAAEAFWPFDAANKEIAADQAAQDAGRLTVLNATRALSQADIALQMAQLSVDLNRASHDANKSAAETASHAALASLYAQFQKDDAAALEAAQTVLDTAKKQKEAAAVVVEKANSDLKLLGAELDASKRKKKMLQVAVGVAVVGVAGYYAHSKGYDAAVLAAVRQRMAAMGSGAGGAV